MKTPSQIFADECQARRTDMMRNCANDDDYRRRMGEAMRAVPQEELRRRDEAMWPMFANAYWPAVRDAAQEKRVKESCDRQAEMVRRHHAIQRMPWWWKILWKIFGD